MNCKVAIVIRSVIRKKDHGSALQTDSMWRYQLPNYVAYTKLKTNLIMSRKLIQNLVRLLVVQDFSFNVTSSIKYWDITSLSNIKLKSKSSMTSLGTAALYLLYQDLCLGNLSEEFWRRPRIFSYTLVLRIYSLLFH